MHPQNFDPYEFSQKDIAGVPVYYKHISTSPCIHIRICFNTGSLHDPANQVGISHFLEHMIFDGAPGIPDKKATKEWSKVNALNSWNAWTWFTNTTYHLRCLPEKFDDALAGMKSMIFFPFLKEEDVEHERSVITQEAWGRFQNEKYLAYTKEMLDNTYHGTAREKVWSPLGWPDSIAKIRQNDVAYWHKKNYGRGNFFMVISGAVTEQDIQKLEAVIVDLPQAERAEMEFEKLTAPKYLHVTKRADEIGIIQEQVIISFEQVLEPEGTPSEEVRFMAEALLQDILFERLRTEKALCYGVSVDSHRQKDYLTWSAHLKTKEEEKDTVLEEFWKALDDIISGKETQRFDVLKQVRIDRLKSTEELTGDITDAVLADLWRTGKILTNKERLQERRAITYADVTTSLAQAFDKNRTVTEIILPSKK
jgi:predicted Zn-dependent peptidase